MEDSLGIRRTHSAEKAQLPSLRFDSKIGPLKYLVNNGYTIRVNYHDAPGTGNLLIVGDQSYQLTQFHFHRPSEEYIHGKPFDMAVHLMYQSRDGKVGSVTAPPCTEGVRWYVLKTPMDISTKQIEAFAKLYPHDVRPLQPLNGRVVQESQ
jgi:carbonic anhydrase